MLSGLMMDFPLTLTHFLERAKTFFPGREIVSRLPDGSLQVPKDWDTAGWYDKGPRPGQPGPAVILGHVDSKTGPAVFYRLRALRPPDIVRVGLADGRTLVFRVQRVERYPKDEFPTEAVYFPTLNRELRLITCGGEFDYAAKSYRDNIVVYAVRTA